MQLINYEVETRKHGHVFSVDNTKAPFNGEPVLLLLSEGWAEGYWVPEERCNCGTSCDCDWGFYWYSEVNGKAWDITDVEYWSELPVKG